MKIEIRKNKQAQRLTTFLIHLYSSLSRLYTPLILSYYVLFYFALYLCCAHPKTHQTCSTSTKNHHRYLITRCSFASCIRWREHDHENAMQEGTHTHTQGNK